ncbi:MAG: hypothetical protein N2376_07360 [Clostridia bacterium]|nr:hypothetical protein [Clostridia bacterium]
MADYQELQTQIEYLKAHAQNPTDYVLSKFREKDIILLAENHAIKENLLFVQSLIPKLHAAGVYNIGMEFGASEDQEELDALVNGESYDPDKARELMFRYNVIFPYVEYMDIYKRVWEFNRTLPQDAPRMRVLNLSYQYNWEGYPGYRTVRTTSKVFHKGSTERYRAELIDREILQKSQKLLVLTGTIHAFTKYKNPVCDFLEEGFVRLENGYMGHLLYQKAPDKVITILLHFTFMDEDASKGYRLPADGQIEALMEAFNNEPVGFDLKGTPLGQLRDHSNLALGHPDFKLEDLADGYVFLKPLMEQTGCTVDYDYLKGHTFEEVLKQFPDPEWHPKLNSLEDYWELVEGFVDMHLRRGTY